MRVLGNRAGALGCIFARDACSMARTEGSAIPGQSGGSTETQHQPPQHSDYDKKEVQELGAKSGPMLFFVSSQAGSENGSKSGSRNARFFFPAAHKTCKSDAFVFALTLNYFLWLAPDYSGAQ